MYTYVSYVCNMYLDFLSVVPHVISSSNVLLHRYTREINIWFIEMHFRCVASYSYSYMAMLKVL